MRCRMNSKKYRDPALDIIRCIAMLCVICVHFFLNTNFYDHTVSGVHMLIMSIMRNSFMICVPLFMMLTGYLVQSKEVTKTYYFKIIRTIYIYIFSSILCGLYGIFILKNYTIPSAVLGIFTFETAPYSWYIEMYLGFYLLIPFLNIMYDGLYTQKKKQLLIISLLLLTALPSILNIYNIYYIHKLDWWLMPSKSPNHFHIVPDWWTNIYPITYFFLGKYFRDYPIRFNPKQIAVLTVFVFLFAGIFNYYRSYGSTFLWGPWQEYGSILVTLQTVLIFNFFVKIKYNKLPAVCKSVFSKISDLSLGAYLTSWIFDSIVYERLNRSVHTIQQKLIWFPVVVTLVLIGSLMCSYVINFSYSLVVKKLPHRHATKEVRN